MRWLALLLTACAAKSPDPVVAPVASSSATTKPVEIVATTPPPPPAPPKAKCPAAAMADQLLSCTGITAKPTYLEVLDALQKENNEGFKRQKPQKKGDLSPKPLGPLQQKVIDTARAFRCSGQGDAAQQDEVTYELGRTYWEARHWEEAAAVFHVLAQKRSDVSSYAAQLALEGMNVLATEQKRADCKDELLPRLREYRDRLCRPTPSDREMCKTFDEIEKDVEKR